eukprot:GEMP01070917.1.p1 GENE.GEMP01070917.1~~GEMP01070917.1.p1  ORF type:complete len:286 (+),score=36.89 GEMP01070917.1:106-963(+)
MYGGQQHNPYGQQQHNPYGQPEQLAYQPQDYEFQQEHHQQDPINAPPAGQYGYGDGEVKLSNDLDIVIRHGFIRKVFSVVGAQLVLTALISLPFYIYHDVLVHQFAGSLTVMILVVSVLTMCLMCYMTCKPEIGRQYPKNYIILTLITTGMGCMVGMATMHYTGRSILIAVGMTAAITVGLMAFAMQTKYDFTGMGPYLFAALMALTLFGFILIFVGGAFAHKLYAGCGALLFSFYLIYDTQLIVGGNDKKFKFGIDDYVFAALTLYLDIINLFLYLLELFGDRR